MDLELTSACVMATATVCQQIIGDLLLCTCPVDPSGFVDWFAAVPRPTSYNDAAVAACVLLRFMQDLGTAMHSQLHVGLSAGCRFDATLCAPAIVIDPTNPSGWHPAPVFARWAARYVTALGDYHDLTVERVRHRLMSNPARPIRLDALARDVAMSPSVMRRRFCARTGETPRQYRTRLRVVEAIRLIREGWKRDAVAAALGWKSRKDVYRALKLVAGVSADQVCAMSNDEANALTARLVVRPLSAPGEPESRING